MESEFLLIGLSCIDFGNPERFLLALLGSFIFSLLEMSLYKIKDGYYFTSKEQFLMNMIFIPFMVEEYNRIFSSFRFSPLLYPVNVWLFELIMGHFMIIYLGKNPAWSYHGEYSKFNGQIDLECYFRWVFLGVLQDFLYHDIFLGWIRHFAIKSYIFELLLSVQHFCKAQVILSFFD